MPTPQEFLESYGQLEFSQRNDRPTGEASHLHFIPIQHRPLC
ncbi:MULTISPECIES: hypothetical protein [Oscillatoriales]|nr:MULTISPECIES: hypothetical protein [Oscillatoriales]